MSFNIVPMCYKPTHTQSHTYSYAYILMHTNTRTRQLPEGVISGTGLKKPWQVVEIRVIYNYLK